MMLVENFVCNSKDESHQRERFYIENNECVNLCVPLRTKSKYYEQFKNDILEKQKQHYEQDKEIILERQKEYRENNVEIIKNRKTKYRENNVDKIKEHNKNIMPKINI
jgi:hypothetical protein